MSEQCSSITTKPEYNVFFYAEYQNKIGLLFFCYLLCSVAQIIDIDITFTVHMLENILTS